MRSDLQLSLQRSGIDASRLKEFQRIILTTDGTVTDILEAYCREPMRIVILSQGRMKVSERMPTLALEAGHEVLSREILLEGEISGTSFLYAHSLIVFDRLSTELQDGLLLKQKSIGHLILEYRVETFKEITSCSREPSKALASRFRLHEAAPLLSRTYTLSTRAQPIMQITEKIPEWGR
jgi:chorismate-pyruvate lyase